MLEYKYTVEKSLREAVIIRPYILGFAGLEIGILEVAPKPSTISDFVDFRGDRGFIRMALHWDPSKRAQVGKPIW